LAFIRQARGGLIGVERWLRLRSRARKVLGGWEDWDDRTGAARALNLAATVLEDWEGVR
jgi:hypothetical protein